MINFLKSKLLIKFIVRSMILLFISIICIEYVTYKKTSDIIHHRINEQLEREVKQKAQDIERQIQQLIIDAKILAELPAIEELILNSNYGLAAEAKRIEPLIAKFIDNQIERNNSYIQFGICDKSQQLLFIYPKSQPLQKALSCDMQKSTQLKILKDSKFMLAQKPIERREQQLGTVFILFNTTNIFTSISNQRIFNNGFWALFDENMMLLTELQHANLAFSDQIKQVEHVDDVTRNMNIDGNSAYIYPFNINPTNWHLYAVAYQDEMFTDVIELLYLISFIVIIVFIVEVLFLSYFTNTIVIRPIKELLKATQHITQGNFDHKIEVNNSDEIGKLSETFNTMTNTVADKIAKLNHEKQQSYESKALLQSIIDNTPDIIYLKDIEHKYILVNKAYLSLFDLRPEDVISKTDYDLFPRETAKAFIQNDSKVIEHRKSYNFEEAVINKNGKVKHYISVKFPMLDQQNNVYASCGISTDVTTIKEKEYELRSINQELKLIYSIFETGQECIVVANDQWLITDVNRALINNFAFVKNELLNTPAFNLVSEQQDISEQIRDQVSKHGYWQGEVLLLSKSQKTYPQLCSVNKVVDDEYHTTHYIMLFSDITQLKETQKQLEQLAHYDGLTGLFNRYQFNIAVHKAIFESQESHYSFALFFIDLDNFKYINDTMGHEIGDAFLKEVGKRLLDVTRTSDIVARFGGDEFVLLLKNLREQDYVSTLADKIREAINTIFIIQNKEIYASASIGIALYPQDGQTSSELIKAADIAMYSAKEKGKNAYQFFMPEMNLAIKEKLNYEESLRTAIQDDEFEFHYQPKHCTSTNLSIEAEGLLRWRKNGKQMIMPDEFIPIAEESGLIVPISYHIFDHGCRFVHELEAQFQKPVHLSFNLSGRQFRQHDLAQKLFAITERHSISPSSIDFEITESVIMEDPDLAKDICEQLKAVGFTLSLDDFGTGYSSLSYIREYPIDSIKVDRTFITNVETDVTNQAIINAVLSIAKSMQLEVICEGVETKQQLDFLKNMGVSHIQGYYFSPPLEEEKFIQYLIEHYFDQE
ncbi:EAL domain-containing protein [Colwelliaceae bacterium 6471]